MAKQENLPAATSSSLLEEVKLCLKEPGRKLSVTEGDASSMIDRMLSATDLDSLDEAVGGALTPAEQILGQPVRVHEVRFGNSDFSEQGLGIYAILDVETEDGKRIGVSCGGTMVIAYFVRRAELGGLPVDVIISKSPKATRAGFYPLNVARAEFTAEEPF